MMELWYHNDFDGIVSGAMLATALETQVTGVPVDYNSIPTTHGPVLAVVDFQFQPGAMIWVDHHATAFRQPEWRTQVDAAQHPWWIWEPTAPSCAQLLGTTLRARHMFPEQFALWEPLATRIDTASYTSPQAYLDLTDPAAALAQIYSALGVAERQFMFRALAFASPETLLDRFTTLVALLRQTNEAASQQFEHVASCTNGVVHADLTSNGAPWVRFSGFAMYPKADLAVTLMSRGHQYGLSLSGNPWTETPLPHLGQLAQQHGGGGHARAAGMTFDTYAEALSAYWTFIRTVQTA